MSLAADLVEVEVAAPVDLVEVEVSAPVDVVEVLVPGPQGPPGPGGGNAGQVIHFESLAEWSGSHNLGRLPSVALYIDGQQILAQVDSTTTHAVATFPSPQTGDMVLN